MEGIPRIPLIALTCRTSSKSPSFDSMKEYIRTHYEDSPSSYGREFEEFATLRQKALEAPCTDEGLAVIMRYYCQLQLLKRRFPMGENEACNITFTWSDQYMKFPEISSDVTLEEGCILYNIAAIRTSIACQEKRLDSESMKKACTQFQCAAGCFHRIMDLSESPDMSSENIKYLNTLMLAQAQECIFEKTLLDNRKPALVAKIAQQISDYYALCQRYVEGDDMEYMCADKTLSTWKRFCIVKKTFYLAMAQYFMGLDAEEREKHGEVVTWLSVAAKNIAELEKAVKDTKNAEFQETYRFAVDVIQGKFNSAKKDNDFVYHDRVPDLLSLEEIRGASLVKGIGFDVHDPNIVKRDIFQRLLPLDTLQAASVFSEKVAQLLRSLSSEIDTKNMDLEKTLSSLNLQMDQFRLEDRPLPQEVYDLSAKLHASLQSPDKDLARHMQDLVNDSVDAESALRSLKESIQEEDTAEQEFKVSTANRQVAKSFMEELKQLRGRCEELSSTLSNAAESNALLRDHLKQALLRVKRLLQPLNEIEAGLPSVAALKNENTSVLLGRTEYLLNKVEAMRSQRRELMDAFRAAIQKEDITQILLANRTTTGSKMVSDESLFEKVLNKFQPQMDIIRQNLTAQENLLEALITHNADIVPTKKLIMETRRRRDDEIAALTSDYEEYQQLTHKCEEAKVFYHSVLEKVTALQEKFNSLHTARSNERQNYLQMLPKASASVPAAPIPGAASPLMGRRSDLQMPFYPSDLTRAPGAEKPKLKDYLKAKNMRDSMSVSSTPASMPESMGAPFTPNSQISSSNSHPIHTSQPNPMPFVDRQAPNPSPNPFIYAPQNSPRPPHLTGDPSAIPVNNAYPPNMPRAASLNTPSAMQNFPPLSTNQTQVRMNSQPTPVSMASSSCQPAPPTQQGQPQIFPYGAPPGGHFSSFPPPNQPFSPQPSFSQAPSHLIQTSPQSVTQRFPTSQGSTHPPELHQNPHQTMVNGGAYLPPSTYPSGVVPQQTFSQTAHNGLPQSPMPRYHPPQQQVSSQPAPGSNFSQYYQVPPQAQMNAARGMFQEPTRFQSTGSMMPPGYLSQPGATSAPYPQTTGGLQPSQGALTLQQRPQHPLALPSAQAGHFYQQMHSVQGSVGPQGSPTFQHMQPHVPASVPFTQASVGPQSIPSQQSFDPTSLPVGAQPYQPIPGAQVHQAVHPQMQAPLAPQSVHPSYPVSNNSPSHVSTPPSTSAPRGLQPQPLNPPCQLQDVKKASSAPIDLLSGSPNELMQPTFPPTLAQENTFTPSTSFNSFSQHLPVTTENVEPPHTSKLPPQTPTLQPTVLSTEELIKQRKEEQLMKQLRHTTQDPLLDNLKLNHFISEVERNLKRLYWNEDRCGEGISSSGGQAAYWTQEWKKTEDKIRAQLSECKPTMAAARCSSTKNRFQEFVPYDRNRVVLSQSKDDYINASLIEVKLSDHVSPRYIACQSPLPNTMSDLWLMLLEQSCEVSVHLGKVVSPSEVTDSSDKNIMLEYWPTEKGRMQAYGSLDVNLQAVKVKESWLELIITIRNRANQQTRTLTHFVYTEVTSKLPNQEEKFAAFIRDVHIFYKQQRNPLRPLAVISSSGCGIAGVFIASSAAMLHMDSEGEICNVSPNLICDIVIQRPYVMESKEQYISVMKTLMQHAAHILAKKGIVVGSSVPRHSVSSPQSGHATGPPINHVAANSADIVQNALLDNLVDLLGGNSSGNLALDFTKNSGSDSPYAPPTSADVNISKVPRAREFSDEDKSQVAPFAETKNTADPFDLKTLSENLSLEPIPKNQRKITRYDFERPRNVTSNNATPLSFEPDPLDPLSSLDPLWNFTKATAD